MIENINCLILFFSSRVVRKAIARVYIVMHQKQKENLRKLFKVSVLRSFFFPPPPPPSIVLEIKTMFCGEEESLKSL